MNHDSEKWLDDRISEDVDRMADKRIKELMESEELKDIEATMDQLQSIRKRLGLVDAEDEHDMEIARELTPEVPAHSHVKVAPEESTTSEAAAAKAEGAHPMLRVTMRVTWWRSVRLRHLQHRIIRKLSVIRVFACALPLLQRWWQFSHWELVWSAPVKKCICRW